MTQMTIGACSNFHTTVVKYITATTAEALHITDKAPAYTEATQLLASIVNRRRAFVTTPQMRETDVRRDNAAGAISSVINALLKSPVDERRHAAELLYQQMSPYRGIGRHEYNKETAEIRGMLAMLAETDNAAAVTTLGLSPEVEALREANAAFEEAFDARNDEVSLQHAIVQPTDEINAFIDKLNGLTGSLASVSGSTASGSEGPDVPEPEPTGNEEL